MKKKVLVIDDEQDVVKYMSQKLARADYMPFVAFDGQEGLDIVYDNDLDLIMTDIVMPGVDGYNFFNKIKKLKNKSGIPVVVFSAYANLEKAFRQLGAVDFLAKPFDGQKFMETVERNVNRSPVPGVIPLDKLRDLNGKVVLQIASEDPLNEQLKLVQRDDSPLCLKTACAVNDVIEESLRSLPDIIILDGLNPDAPVEQTVKTLKSYPVLKNAGFYIYANGQEGPYQGKTRELMQGLCAGECRFLGRLTLETFLTVLKQNSW